jgi:hypothetical protein
VLWPGAQPSEGGCGVILAYVRPDLRTCTKLLLAVAAAARCSQLLLDDDDKRSSSSVAAAAAAAARGDHLVDVAAAASATAAARSCCCCPCCCYSSMGLPAALVLLSTTWSSADAAHATAIVLWGCQQPSCCFRQPGRLPRFVSSLCCYLPEIVDPHQRTLHQAGEKDERLFEKQHLSSSLPLLQFHTSGLQSGRGAEWLGGTLG